MVLLNLPREIRFLKENWIVVGIIPNLKKEPSCLNTFQDPIVKELLALWKGTLIKASGNPLRVSVRAALLCVSCYVPACRKIWEFMGHSAKQGCSKCTKLFEGKVGSMDYSGFDVHIWGRKTVNEHRICADQLKNNEHSKTSGKKFQSDHGY